MWVGADTTHGCTRYPDHGAAEDRVQLTPARTRHRVSVSKVVSVSGQVPGVAINVRHHITSQVAVGDQSPLTQPPQYPHSMTSLPANGHLELSWHLVVPTLLSYIQWKMDDDHTYHNMKVHDNTIHHMVLTTYFSMHACTKSSKSLNYSVWNVY